MPIFYYSFDVLGCGIGRRLEGFPQRIQRCNGGGAVSEEPRAHRTVGRVIDFPMHAHWLESYRAAVRFFDAQLRDVE